MQLTANITSIWCGKVDIRRLRINSRIYWCSDTILISVNSNGFVNKPSCSFQNRSLGIRLKELQQTARKLSNYSRYLTEIPTRHPPHTNQKVQRFRTTWILSDSNKLGIPFSGTFRGRDWQLATLRDNVSFSSSGVKQSSIHQFTRSLDLSMNVTISPSRIKTNTHRHYGLQGGDLEQVNKGESRFRRNLCI